MLAVKSLSKSTERENYTDHAVQFKTNSKYSTKNPLAVAGGEMNCTQPTMDPSSLQTVQISKLLWRGLGKL